MMLEPEMVEPNASASAWVDLSRYDQSGFDRGRPTGLILLWWLVQAVIFPLTLHNMSGVRCWLLRLFGAKVGRRVVVRPSARFTYPWKVKIGDYCWLGDDVVFYSLDKIEIGAHAVVSQKCYLCTGSHDLRDRRFCLQTAPIRIGPGAWLATDCFVGLGVTIGANTVVGARSSVYRDLPPGKVAWGNPARVYRDRVMEEE